MESEDVVRADAKGISTRGIWSRAGSFFGLIFALIGLILLNGVMHILAGLFD